MSTFFYRALAPDGKIRTGTLAGEDDRAAVRELRRQGLTPVFVGASKPSGFSLRLPRFGGKRLKDLLHFTQEVATLLNAGVPLDRALSITSELTDSKEFQSIVGEVLRSLRSGKSLAESLEAHPQYFSELYVSMIRAGEASGSLARCGHHDRAGPAVSGSKIRGLPKQRPDGTGEGPAHESAPACHRRRRAAERERVVRAGGDRRGGIS
jgi:type II secretory pathway component PulF